MMMEEESPQLELYIDTCNENMDKTVQSLLSPDMLTQVIKQTLNKANVTEPVMLTLLITDDRTIQDLNKQYRQQDKPTDVLSFPLLEAPLIDAPEEELWAMLEENEQAAENTPAFITPEELLTNLGDIVISWPTVVQQAATAGHSPTFELLYLLSHGVLHLIGYDDQSEAGYQKMVQLQQTVLATVGQKV